MSSSSFNPAALCVPGVRELKAYEPGKPISELERELGLTDIVKLASNENPLGASPKAIAAMQVAVADMALYPDGNSHALKHALSEYHDIDPARIVTASGSDHILELVARAFLDGSNSAVMSRYGFAIFAIVARATGTDLRFADAHAPDHVSQPYGHDAQALIDATDESTRILYIANPNNPTGTWLNHAEIKHVLDSVSDNTIVFLDEAYYDYVVPFHPDFPDSRALLERYPNLVITRTFSKAYGLAGVRVGYALGSAAMADVLNRVRLSFNPGSLGQVGATAALADHRHVERTVNTNRRELEILDAGLRRLGLATIPSVCNFVTVDVGRPGREVFQALLEKGLITRPLDPYGLPNHLRITVGLEAQNKRLLEALGQILA